MIEINKLASSSINSLDYCNQNCATNCHTLSCGASHHEALEIVITNIHVNQNSTSHDIQKTPVMNQYFHASDLQGELIIGLPFSPAAHFANPESSPEEAMHDSLDSNPEKAMHNSLESSLEQTIHDNYVSCC